MKMKTLLAIFYLISARSIHGFVFSSRSDNKLNLGFEFPLNLTRSSDDIDPDIIEESFMKTPELILKYGYPSEVHKVITEDGYILEMHRIPKNGGKPVLLMHGLLDSSSTWVIMRPKKALAYILSDLGYDVWMGNARGNRYSKNHKSLDVRRSKFWQFTFHEMGKYDLPAMIDYVLNATKHEQLHYVGHSQGTMTFWIMCSERPEYNKKIKLMQALAPVAFLNNCKSLGVNFLAYFRRPVGILLKLIGVNEFLPSSEFLGLFSQIMCKDQSLTQEICTNAIFIFTGYDKNEMNTTMLPIVFGHTPAGASVKQIMHYGQVKDSGKFRQYDYGYFDNYWKYGSIYPPEYDLTKVTTKVAIHYSQNDWLAEQKDVEHLYETLPNTVGKYMVGFERFNHLDFVWAIDAKKMLYDKLAKMIALVESDKV